MPYATILARNKKNARQIFHDRRFTYPKNKVVTKVTGAWTRYVTKNDVRVKSKRGKLQYYHVHYRKSKRRG